MAPQRNQNVCDKEAAAIGIEVVPLEKLRSLDTEEDSSLEDGSRTTPTTTVQPISLRSRMTRREYMFAGISVIALIGLAVGLGVALSPPNHSTNSGNDSTSTAPPFGASESVFTETKEYIDNVCSSEDSLTLCRLVCAPADCCTVGGDGDNDSCFPEQASSCLEYAKCHAVLTDFAPPAPQNLHDVCSRSDLDDCRDACQAVTCCFENDSAVGESSCRATQLLTCLDYAPCQVLRNYTNVPPFDTEQLLQMCALSEDGTAASEECEVACQDASCCWNGNCLETDLINCLTYAPCDELVLPSPNTKVDVPTSNIQQVCSVESIFQQDSYQECRELCDKASCCTDATDNCILDDPLGCLMYEPCNILPLVGGSVPPPPDNLRKICNGVDDLDSGALQTCIDSCEPAACCVAEGDDNCVDDGNAWACSMYGICEPVYALSGGSVQSPPSTLSQFCSSSNLSTVEGYTACASLCEPAACCNSLGSDNCMLENISTCGEWNIGGCYLLTSTRGGN